jgi:hypothetical protein
MFWRVYLWFLSSARWIWIEPSEIWELRFILILLSCLHLYFLSGLFLSAFLTKTLYEYLIPTYASYMSCQSYPPQFDLTLWYLVKRNYEVQVVKLLIMQLPSSSCTSSVSDLNILLSILFSNTLNLCTSLRVRDKFHKHVKQQIKL